MQQFNSLLLSFFFQSLIIQFNFIYITRNHNNSCLEAVYPMRERPNKYTEKKEQKHKDQMSSCEKALWQKWEKKKSLQQEETLGRTRQPELLFVPFLQFLNIW